MALPEGEHQILKTIAKIALPFAGVTLGWYLFMPNFEWLRIQEQYRSQAVIDLIRAKNLFSELKYQIFTPKAIKQWNACVLKSGWDYIEALGHKNESGEYVSEKWTETITLEQYKINKCGTKPSDKP